MLADSLQLFVGLSFPYEGPAPLEAIANGCTFLNPRFNTPKSSKNTEFFKGKPTFREVRPCLRWAVPEHPAGLFEGLSLARCPRVITRHLSGPPEDEDEDELASDAALEDRPSLKVEALRWSLAPPMRGVSLLEVTQHPYGRVTPGMTQSVQKYGSVLQGGVEAAFPRGRSPSLEPQSLSFALTVATGM